MLGFFVVSEAGKGSVAARLIPSIREKIIERLLL
jgi:hypothetical protein